MFRCGVWDDDFKVACLLMVRKPRELSGAAAARARGVRFRNSGGPGNVLYCQERIIAKTLMYVCRDSGAKRALGIVRSVIFMLQSYFSVMPKKIKIHQGYIKGYVGLCQRYAYAISGRRGDGFGLLVDACLPRHNYPSLGIPLY